ncbi:formylglycine-generating enzyme family protein [Thalassospira australica]|uniref:formylglycine-generating enzyme family protein n=1 Tax=Thalassospira australica TaxID=1528106 RepID=UPI0038515BE0
MKRLYAGSALAAVCILGTVAIWFFGKDDSFVRLEGGTFKMGSDRHYQEERAVHQVTVGSFQIKKTEVTNAEFAEFVAETNYVTTAENDLDPQKYPGVPAYLLQAGSMVFAQPPNPADSRDFRKWWRYVAGANWRHPLGSESTIDGLENHPVVQISPEDAAAYAKWAGGRLPTEAEWEFAARGGLDGADYSWGEGYDPSQGWKANTWQGEFPNTDTEDDGYHGTAPVGSFAPNAYGLLDMAGNVWEHVSDWWVPFHPAGTQDNPQGPPKAIAATFADPSFGPMHVVKGGSWLCAPSYCLRYRPAARQQAETSLSTNHIGFRIVKDVRQ